MAVDVRLELGYRRAASASERLAQKAIAWEAPRLPCMTNSGVPRWSAGPTWTPPGTILLVRHRRADGGGCIVTNDRRPPEGYVLEYDLGLVHSHAQPGTERLVATDDGFFTTPIEGTLRESLRALGYVEQAALPMLDALILCRDPSSHQPTLFAGADDPLSGVAEPLGCLGFVESYPLNPRHAPDTAVDRFFLTLLRQCDEDAWRHRYSVFPDRTSGSVALGGVLTRPNPGLIELWLGGDGTLSSDLLAPRSQETGGVTTLARWAAAPLSWGGAPPQAWALRASGSRLRHLARGVMTEQSSSAAMQSLGYVRREAARGWSPLFAARHPALRDQFLTRSELEAQDMGYVIEGILGYVADHRADRTQEAMPREIKWASRFGHQRRYREGGHGA